MQLQVQLASAMPYDLDEMQPALADYKNLDVGRVQCCQQRLNIDTFFGKRLGIPS